MAAINNDLHTKSFFLNAYPELKMFSQKLKFSKAVHQMAVTFSSESLYSGGEIHS